MSHVGVPNQLYEIISLGQGDWQNILCTFMKNRWCMQFTSNICQMGIHFCLGCICGRKIGLSNPLRSDLQNGICGKTGKAETHFLNISCKYYIMTNRCV